MELVGFVGSLFGVGGGSAAAAGATAGAAAAGGSSLLATIVQGGLTAFSAAASIGAGMAAKQESKIEEINAATAASRDKISADDEAMRINRALAETIGEQSVAFAAAGIDLSSGTPLQARQEAKKRANEDLNINRSDRNARVAAWNQRALASRSRGNRAMASGIAGAVGSVGDFAVDVLNRGGPVGGARPSSADPWAGLR